MRFNSKELAALAQQPSHKFDREGILFVTEKQDGFFRKTEGKILHCDKKYLVLVFSYHFI